MNQESEPEGTIKVSEVADYFLGVSRYSMTLVGDHHPSIDHDVFFIMMLQLSSLLSSVKRP